MRSERYPERAPQDGRGQRAEDRRWIGTAWWPRDLKEHNTKLRVKCRSLKGRMTPWAARQTRSEPKPSGLCFRPCERETHPFPSPTAVMDLELVTCLSQGEDVISE